MQVIGDENQISWIYSILAVILHVGSLQFSEVKEKSPKRKKEKIRIQVENKEGKKK